METDLSAVTRRPFPLRDPVAQMTRMLAGQRFAMQPAARRRILGERARKICRAFGTAADLALIIDASTSGDHDRLACT